MGRFYWSKKTCVEDLAKVDVVNLRKWGYLNRSQSGKIYWDRPGGSQDSINIASTIKDSTCSIRFIYELKKEGVYSNFDYVVYLSRTYPHLGGERFWFVCNYCRRKVRILYLGDVYFACRKCYKLTYRSRNYNRRSKWWPWAQEQEREWRQEKLWMSMKREYYRGKPTKKYRRIQQLE